MSARLRGQGSLLRFFVGKGRFIVFKGRFFVGKGLFFVGKDRISSGVFSLRAVRLRLKNPFRVSCKVQALISGLGKIVNFVNLAGFFMFWDSLGGWLLFQDPNSKLD